MSHDTLFKTLLRVFFHEFLILFLPALAAAIDPGSIAFLDTQTFTDLPQGKLRIADTVAQVHALANVDDAALVHVETQRAPEAGFDFRMWEYNATLTLRTRMAVISVTLLPFSKRSTGRLKRYASRRFGQPCSRLDYQQVRLGGLKAAEYLARDLPLAWALAALMQPGPGGKVELKRAIIKRLRACDLDEARLYLLVNFMETYLPLSAAEQATLRAEAEDGVEATELTWADKILQQGREQGVLQAKREVVLRQVRARFGAASASLEARLAGADAAMLDRLLDQVVRADSLEEFARLL